MTGVVLQHHNTSGLQLRRAALLIVACTLAAGKTVSAQIVRGTVAVAGDAGSVIASAEVRTPGGQRVRTDDRGTFRVRAEPGDTLRIRALGFRERSVVVDRGEFTVLLQPLATLLDRVITTVGQREIRAGETPASVAVFSAADIAAAGAVSANQLLRRLPGLQEIGSPPARTSIAIRGLDQSRVLVLVDGEPVAGAMTENRDIGRLSTLAAERIEVVKGPSSVEFGSDALGGVINLVTAAPTAAPSAHLNVRNGGLGRREASAEVSNTFGPLGFRLSGGWRQSDRVTAINSSSSTLDRVYDFRGDMRVRLSDRVTLRTDLTFSQQRQRWPVGAGFNGFIDNRSVQGFAETQVRAGGGVLRARLFAQRYSYQFREALGAIPVAGSADSLEQREEMVRALFAYSRPVGSHVLDAGVQLSARGIVAPTKIDGDRANDRVLEFFARDAWSVGPLLMTAGARSSSSALWGSALSPSVGAVWQASPSVRGRANVARGFRAPAFKEMRYTFINGAAGYQIVGNANLMPESSWSSSAGVTWAPVPTIAIELDAYRNTLSNLISTRNTGTNNAGLLIYQNVNVARARTEGVEVGFRVSRAMTELTIGYDLLRARDLETGATLDGRATHTGRLAIARQWSLLGGSVADLSTRYTGAAPRATGTQAAFLSTEAQLRVGARQGVELSLGVVNLFDARPAGWTPAFQRQVTVGLSAGWRRR